MKYQKIRNLLDNTNNQPSKMKTKNQVEVNDDLCRTYNVNSQIKRKIMMLMSSLCDSSNAYIRVKGTIPFAGQGADTAAIAADKNYKQVIFKNGTPVTNCIREINNAQIDNTKDVDIVMPIYNLVEYSSSYDSTARTILIII